MRFVRWLLRMSKFGAVFAVCGAITVFILASSYETAFGKDLPYINSVNAVDLSVLSPALAPLNDAAGITANQTAAKYEGTYGTPSDFKSSRSEARVAIAPPLSAGGKWLSRASAAHYIVTTPAKGANIGDVVLYMRGGPTTVLNAQEFQAGDNIFMDTKRDWRYLYKVDEVITTSGKLKYVMGQSSKPRLYAVVSAAAQPQVIVAATLINVQSAVQ